MPAYLYRNPKTGKVIEVIQKMTDNHIYQENGLVFDRVWLTPRMAVDSVNLDPFSKKDFLRHTEKRMTLGQMQNVSKEFSEMRENQAGRDPIKQKIFDDYERKTKKRHPENKLKKIETKNFIAEFD